MERPPENEPFYAPDRPTSVAWIRWFHKLWIVAGSVDGHGTTANRPTTNLFVNRPYLDETLGRPIWLKSVNPTVWIDATGAPV